MKGWKKLITCIMVLVILLSTLGISSAHVGYQSVFAPVPDVVGPVPVTETSYPFNAANRQVVPVNLADYGYVEEEYFVSGKANVYEWLKVGAHARVRTENAPYTTRILVRRPANVEAFSGDVLVELYNWSRGYDGPFAGWGQSYDHYMSKGDIWIGLTERPVCVESLKKFNPERYAPLSLANPLPVEQRVNRLGTFGFFNNSRSETEDGLAWDIISQVGALVKSKGPSNPLSKYNVKYVFGTGATGGDLSAYVAAVHSITTLDKTLSERKPVYDGFFIIMTGSPNNINQEEERMKPYDERCKLFSDVPVIRALTMGDVLGEGDHADWGYLQRRPDSDLSGQQFRLYEIPGASVGNRYDKLSGPCKEDVIATGKKWTDFTVPKYEYPMRYIYNGTLENLKLWVKYGTPPPRADRLGVYGYYPNAKYDLDTYGNITGGVRTPYVDVPITTYTWDGKIIPFDKALLKQLYPDHNFYVSKVTEKTRELVRDRWITERDAQKIIQEAVNAEIP